MDKRSLNRPMVSYKCFMAFMFFLPLCSPHCHSGLSNHIIPGNATWKLCVKKTYVKDTLQLKIKGLFPGKDKSGWLSIGFHQVNEKNIKLFPFFLLNMTGGNAILQQTKAAKKQLDCSISGTGHPKLVSVNCHFEEAMNKYVNSKKIDVFWNTGKGSRPVGRECEKLKGNHSTLTFDLSEDENQLPENAGSTAMRLLQNYGKSMGVIIGISFLLTFLITLTICCCCKKKIPVGVSKQKLSKDASVSFYRDDSEGDGQSASDESDNDEKVAFIRNNNDRNSAV